MQLSPRYNFRYPELTDQVSAFPPDVAAQNALLLDQVIGSLTDATTAALAGKAPTSHTHTMGQVTGLGAALAGKAPTSHTHTMGQVTGLDAALAGKAPTSHTHTMGQVTGLDAALAGKANATTLDARVPSNMALRLDTTVGTRIFAGATMIYGDTGWRDITSSLLNGWTANRVLIRRQGSTVVLSTLNLSRADATSNHLLVIPSGFHRAKTFVSLLTPAGYRPAYFNTAGALTIWTSATVEANAYAECVSTWEVPASHAWPSTLLGTPA